MIRRLSISRRASPAGFLLSLSLQHIGKKTPQNIMSGKGKGGRGKGKANPPARRPRRPRLASSSRWRLNRYLRKGKYASRVGVGAGVYMGAVLEYLCARSSSWATPHNRRREDAPPHQLAVRNDEELNKLLGRSRPCPAVCSRHHATLLEESASRSVHTARGLGHHSAPTSSTRFLQTTLDKRP